MSEPAGGEEVEDYLRRTNFTEALEAVLSGLAVMRPDNSLQYIEEALDQLKHLDYSDIQWDMLIPEDMRPKKKVVIVRGSDRGRSDAADEPSAEKYELACNHYNKKILGIVFQAMKRFMHEKRLEEIEFARKLGLACAYNHRCLTRRFLFSWRLWTEDKKRRGKAATSNMKTVLSNYVSQVIFDSWYQAALEAKKTREYFERLERGEQAEDVNTEDEPASEGTDAISMLPVEVSAKIFSKLNVLEIAKCGLVCRSWKQLLQSGQLWNTVDLSFIGPRLRDGTLSAVMAVARPFLVHVNLRGCTEITQNGFSALTWCRNLQDVNVSCTKITDTVVEDLAFSCDSSLLYLNLANTPISDNALRAISNTVLNLQYLSIASCHLVTDKGIGYLSKGRLASQIRHLDISNCNQIGQPGYECISRHFPNLRSFYCDSNRNTTNQCLLPVIEKCRRMRSVSLRFTPNISDDSLYQLHTLKQLTWLRIEGNARLSDNTLAAVGEMCEQLRHLYATDCPRITEISCRALGQLRHIVVVNLSDCIRINDAAVRALVEGPSGPFIRELNLTNCIRVSDVSLLRIAQRCGSLRFLTLCHLEHITDAGLECLGNIASLFSLDLTGCNVQDAGIQNLASNVNVKQLTLAGSSQLTDLGIQKYVSVVTNLELINVSFCSALSDGTFKNIAYSCRKLTTLGLAGCTLVGDMTIQYISGACPYLCQLDVSGCTDLTDKSIKFIRKGCRRLRVLIMLYCGNITRSNVMKLKKVLDVVEWSPELPPPGFGFSQVTNLLPVAPPAQDTNTDTNPSNTKLPGQQPVVAAA